MQRFSELKKSIGPSQARKAVRKSRFTLWRWQRLYAANGLAGLMPRSQNSGRRSAAAGVRLNAKSIQALETFILQTGSTRKAWQHFKSSRHCPPALAALKIKGMPSPFERLVKPKPLQQRCKMFLSADGRRVLFKIKGANPK